MVALIAMLAIMSFALMLALPSWRYLARDDKEQELIFRGRQIANAVARFQRKNGNTLPTSLEQLVQGKYLRKAYKDPLTRNGEWRILRPGEGVPPPTVPAGGLPGRPTPTPAPSPTATPVFGSGSGGQTGPIAGVVSRSTELGLRMVNGSANYNRWMFAPNVPFVIGGQVAGGRPGGPAQAPPSQGLRAPDLELPRVSR
jgi:type II secretory pathway pseudopilin PulG